jgi:hypothetical protein
MGSWIRQFLLRTKQALEVAENKDYTFKVFPKADHTLESEQPKTAKDERRQTEKYAARIF